MPSNWDAYCAKEIDRFLGEAQNSDLEADTIKVIGEMLVNLPVEAQQRIALWMSSKYGA